MLRLLRTLWYLKVTQIFWRFLYLIYRPTPGASIDEPLKLNPNQIAYPIDRTKKNANFVNGHFYILNTQFSLKDSGWEGYGCSPLIFYNLHYFDYIENCDSITSLSLIDEWICETNDRTDKSWDAYPSSIRIVNWIFFDLKSGVFEQRHHHSLFIQARTLRSRLERDIQANHLFVNAKALIFAGIYFNCDESREWFITGANLLGGELEEQILGDGGHFELSPMYHSLVMEDILDIFNLEGCFGELLDSRLRQRCAHKFRSMVDWLKVMTHPDGNLAFFNDTTFGVAPTVRELESYANRISASLLQNQSDINGIDFVELKESGYLRYQQKKYTMIADIGNIGAAYQPGHAHADCLAFELSVGDARVFVNTGISTYDSSSRRTYERSTKSHNTVCVDNTSSSEVWSSFRVGRRPTKYSFEGRNEENEFSFRAQHNGFSRLFRECSHARTWRCFGDGLEIIDKVNGIFDQADAIFHFGSDISVVTREVNRFLLCRRTGEFLARLEVLQGRAVLFESDISSGFYSLIKSSCLKISLTDGQSHLRVEL